MISLKPFVLISFLALSSFLSGCSIHRMDIQQGNAITQEMLNKLKVGMEQRIVRRIAGSPMITDPFRADRWDYVYSFKHGITNELQYSYVTLFFENEVLQKIDVHTMPLKEDDINSLNRQLREDRS